MAYPNSPTPTLTGSGITPSGQLGAQLAALTRRAFIPSVYVQIYQSHPLLSLFMSNAKAARGGVSQITVPVQGSSFVSFNWVRSLATSRCQPIRQPSRVLSSR
jgi:hypothetical protein